MSELDLILYSREGCCLCEGLEQRLRSLDLHHLKPPVQLHVIDIDSADTPNDLRSRYHLQVPVLVLKSEGLRKMVELPRVSPRLNDEGLSLWLQKVLNKMA